MTNILYVNTFYSPHVKGGAEVMTQLQAELMLKKGERASVLCTRDESGVDCETCNGVRIWRAGIRNLYWHYNGWPRSSFKRKLWHLIDMFNPFVIRLVRRVLTEEKPDIVVCHNLMGWSPAVWVVARSMKIPVVQILHDQYLLCGRSTMRRNGQNCTRRCAVCRMIRAPHQWLSTNVTAVVGVSNFILTRFGIHP